MQVKNDDPLLQTLIFGTIVEKTNTMPVALPSDAATIEPETLYNLLMVEIEPELTTEIVPYLDDIYADEKPEDRKARWDWYAAAFDIFSDQYKGFINGWKEYFMSMR